MRVLIMTSCTGEKTVNTPAALTLDDFAGDAEHLAQREQALAEYLTPAEELYSGLQHVRLMKGIQAVRTQTTSEMKVDLHIVSAGYGLVSGDRKLAPYEATFNGMKKAALKAWAERLNIPTDIRTLLATPYDLGLILLGDHYLETCQLDAHVRLSGPTLLFCGHSAAKQLPRFPNLRVIPLGNPEAKRFSCGLVGLKGELANRVLQGLLTQADLLPRLLGDNQDVLDVLESLAIVKDPLPPSQQTPVTEKGSTKPKILARTNPTVDKVIELRESWWHKPHRTKLRYFIPEWDDLVDPEYNFAAEEHSGGSGDWSNEVYAHQIYPEPNYDGILISKVVAEKSKKKKERINLLGVHRYLRVPRQFPIMGDCGAFGYIMQDTPPYTTDEILDYYTRLDFDYGVSIDHLIVTATEHQKRERYQLTIHNAEEFLREHQKRGLQWTPIGAVQGWDAESYAQAIKQYVAMGYKYIGLGGLVRSPTPQILQILEQAHPYVPNAVALHLFGLARTKALHEFARLGVRSVDSASYLRRAWMGTGQNYLTLDGQLYAAIRIPRAEKSFRAKRMVEEGRASLEQVKRLEQACFENVLAFDQGKVSLETTLNILHEYDQLITPNRTDNRNVLQRTLEARPWKSCPCTLCRKEGIQVIIFGGNNRNRRRGFHNIYTFYRIFQRILAGEAITIGGEPPEPLENQQLELFGT